MRKMIFVVRACRALYEEGLQSEQLDGECKNSPRCLILFNYDYYQLYI